MNFNPNMTFWQSFKIVFVGFIRFPLDWWEFTVLLESVEVIGSYTFTIFIRILLLITLPISAFIMTIIVQIIRKRTANKLKESQ